MIWTQQNTLRFATVQLKWKTGFEHFHFEQTPCECMHRNSALTKPISGEASPTFGHANFSAFIDRIRSISKEMNYDN